MNGWFVRKKHLKSFRRKPAPPKRIQTAGSFCSWNKCLTQVDQIIFEVMNVKKGYKKIPYLPECATQSQTS